MPMTITLGNVLTVLIIMLTMFVQTVLAVAIISRFMGSTETEIKNLRIEYDKFIKTCTECYLKPKIKEIEQAQIDLRKELPVRLQAIEITINDLNEKSDSQGKQLEAQSIQMSSQCRDLKRIKDTLKIREEEVAT